MRLSMLAARTYNCAIMAVIDSIHWKSAVEHDGGVLKCVIVYLARDIPPFVMYYVHGESGSSLLRVYRLYDSSYSSYTSVDLAR